MTGKPPEGKERRNYCRMDDDIILEFTVLDENSSSNTFVAEESSLRALSSICNEIKNIDIVSNKLLVSISSRDPDVGEYLRQINNKIEIITQFIASGSLAKIILRADDNAAIKVNLSAGGVSFYHPSSLAINAMVKVKFFLLPSFECIITDGYVVSCDDAGKEGHRIAFAFSDLGELDEQKIVHHIQAKQLAMRKAARRGTS